MFIAELCDKAVNGRSITPKEAQWLISLKEHTDIMLLVSHANLIRQHFHGPDIDLCAIVNARSGKCSEDCTFCAQSARYDTRIKTYPMLAIKDILRHARRSKKNGVHRFSIVTSGRGITGKSTFKKICAMVQKINDIDGLNPCASLGIMGRDQFRQLRDSGLKRYHHNLETAESFFPSVCSTHSFAHRVATIRHAQEEGFEVCAGGIFGLGETPQQRLELAYALKNLDVDSIPLNFLNPIAGTALENSPLVTPLELLKTIAVYRFLLPTKEIRICGGREVALRTLQPLMYVSGANGVMVGNYLTTKGRNSVIDMREIADLGLNSP